MGKPLPGVEVRVVDRDGRVLAGGEPRYVDDPEATAAAIDPRGRLAAGDAGLALHHPAVAFQLRGRYEEGVRSRL